MKRVLVVEDNDSNYMLMTYILKKHYESLRARNGKEAVEMAEKEHPDLILMDIMMPVMNGLDATKAIREKQPQLPIIALTANAFDCDREQALQAGCNEFMAKPVNGELCLKTIAKLIGE